MTNTKHATCMTAAVLSGKCHNLGRFETELDAHLAVSAWRAERMPFSEDARAA